MLHTSRSYRVADKSLDRPERKQATATEDFEFHVSYCFTHTNSCTRFKL